DAADRPHTFPRPTVRPRCRAEEIGARKQSDRAAAGRFDDSKNSLKRTLPGFESDLLANSLGQLAEDSFVTKEDGLDLREFLLDPGNTLGCLYLACQKR